MQLAKYQSSNNKQVAKKKVKENKKERNNQNQNVFSRCHSAIFKEPFQVSPLHTPLFTLQVKLNYIWPASVSRIFFRSLIFNCYISICKKEKLKDEKPEKIRETNGCQIKEQDVPLSWDSPQVCP